MLDLSQIIPDRPADDENYRYIVAGDVKGWLPLTDEEKAQMVVDAERAAQEKIDNAWAAFRYERDARLKESDIYVLPDRWASYDAATQEAWSMYRQALRDLPSNTVDPFNPVWPTKP